MRSYPVCPYCLNEISGVQGHPVAANGVGATCSSAQRSIPPAYIRAFAYGTPVLFNLFMGYAMHGKTCYLSSLLYSLHETDMYARAWERFSIIGLTRETLASLKYTYIKPLTEGNLPPRTDTVLQEPLILQFQRFPVKSPQLRGLSRIAPRDAVMVFYDIGGEAFNLTRDIANCLPVIARCNPLVFLVDLPALLEQAQQGGSPVGTELQVLVSNVLGVLEQLPRKRGKLQNDILVCFTKADRMWGREAVFGPLSGRPPVEIPAPELIPAYLGELENYSELVGRYLQQNYPPFYNLLHNNFRRVRFVAVSSLGGEPDRNNSLAAIRPMGVFDSIFWSLRLNGLL